MTANFAFSQSSLKITTKDKKYLDVFNEYCKNAKLAVI
jgi:hypothetical protein